MMSFSKFGQTKNPELVVRGSWGMSTRRGMQAKASEAQGGIGQQR